MQGKAKLEVFIGILGLLFTVVGAFAHKFFVVPMPIEYDPRIPALLTLAAGLIALVVAFLMARKSKNRPVLITISSLLGIGVITALICLNYYYLPYTTREISVANDGIMLSGTFFKPRGAGPFPAVLHIHGTTANHRAQCRVFADRLARNGVASLIYDKRGTGKSTGEVNLAGLNQLSGDALACYRRLQSIAGVDGANVGIWGHSEGGVVGSLAAAKAEDCTFLVHMSAPAMSLGEQMMYYHGLRLAEYGLLDSEATWARRLKDSLWASYKEPDTYNKIYNEMLSAKDNEWYAKAGLPPILSTPREVRLGHPAYEWLKADMNYDPLTELVKLNRPLLFIYGGSDDIVPVEECKRRIAICLGSEDRARYLVFEYPGAKHSLYLEGELRYKSIPVLPETMLEDTTNWILGALK